MTEGSLPTPPLGRRDVYIDERGNARGTYLRNQGFIYETPFLRNMASFVFLGKRLIVPSMRDLRLHFWGRPYPPGDMYLRIISKIAGERKLLVVMFPNQYQYRDKKSHYRYYKGLKSLKGVHLMDLYPILEKHKKTSIQTGFILIERGTNSSPRQCILISEITICFPENSKRK